MAMVVAGLPALQPCRWQEFASGYVLQGSTSVGLWLENCGCGRRSPREEAWRPVRTWAVKREKKKKGKEKKRVGGGDGVGGRGKGWSFDQLMLVWDDAFDKCCEDLERAKSLRNLGKKGFEKYGPGCVLVQETVRTLPRGSASGFSYHARPSSQDTDEPPPYTSQEWIAEYVPRIFLLNPSLAPDVHSPPTDASDNSVPPPVIDAIAQGNEELRVVGHSNLISILHGMDTTRLLGLTADTMSAREDDSNGKMGLEIGDAGGEEPYNPRDEQLVLMLAVMVDGQPAVGADVIKAELATPNLEGELLWKFRIRDFAFQPV
ncbi:unnamed protein product [Sphagnum jensenii]|uniref:Uncharacterized protein n=1 Tax=Sphagnum jensenii TaxID=128206 RepID=A0ABP1BY40_9BRYO